MFILHLAIMGIKHNKEWLQYYLSDSNEFKENVCPFTTKEDIAMRSDVTLQRGTPIALEEAVMKLLPETGSVEVQRDTPYREHKTHTHPTNETLLIISGDIAFTVGSKTINCSSGYRALLPSETVHSSIAGKNGCLYILALKFKDKCDD